MHLSIDMRPPPTMSRCLKTFAFKCLLVTTYTQVKAESFEVLTS